MNHLSKAIRQLRPTAEFSFIDDDYLTIKWDVLEGSAPTIAEINKQIENIKAEELLAQENKTNAKNILLDRLGITAEEAALLLA